MKKLETIHEQASEPAPAGLPDQALTSSPVPELKEINGPKGLEPTRFGDWERKGRCVDF
ncbi:DUF1674 domain-containing protein [Methylomonas sp. LL1]|uniref:DUF1674 domain-containing protein n=1 Tax=Methylomonas sp. LL1 TaxID=2785785 RepID=UPI0018C3970E|nr:succinate dehydrogenase assembly factor 4 [Methylomonas sp. LL1]QPK64302.1 DUF1674 domain-containing protein [Methylomonas sp. LL1]